ncbi:MAG TPA: ZIP family metal transporter [Candidatus Omnitrophica bacterium]|nr:ZIP family metal transporter [Candidatus Omnitrophota bacterium]
MQNINVVIYSLIAGFATLLGTCLLFLNEKWARKNSLYLISFAAGVMLAISFLNLMPEAISLSENALSAVLFGILGFYILQQIIDFHPCHDEQCRLHNMGILSFTGLAFHSLLDGVVIALGFSLNYGLGIMTTTAVILHEFPEGITTTGILMYAKMRRSKIIIYSVIVAMATPIGAIFFYPFVKGISDNVLGILLGVAAGSFIYLAVADFIPQIHKAQNKLNALILLLGVAFFAVISRLIH